MPWAPAFLAALSRGAGGVEWVLRAARHSAGRSPFSPSRWDTHRIVAPPVISGASVALTSWQAAGSACTIGLGLEGVQRAAHYPLARGTLAEVVCRYRPTPFGPVAEEVVFRGAVESVVVQGYAATVGLRDLVGVARARPRVDSGGDLFARYDGYNNVSEVATSTWTVASTSLATATNVTTSGSVTSGGSTYGVVYIEPLSGAPFYVYHSTGGTSANTLTNGGGIFPAAFGSIPVNAAVGSRVTTLPAFSAHPISTVQRILATGGAGATDVWDAAGLPSTWGVGLHPAWRDDRSFSAARSIMVASGVSYVGGLAPSEQRYPLQWLSGLLSPWGAWLVCSQGEVGVRVAMDPQRSRPPAVWGGRRIGPHEVVAMRPSDITPGEVPAQARYARVYTGWPQTYGDAVQYGIGDGWPTHTGDSRTGVVTDYTSTDISAWVGPLRGASASDAEAIAEEVAQRIAAWSARVPTVYDVVCRLSMAGLAPGDWVELDRALPFWSRDQRLLGGIRAMVLSVAEDWGAGTVGLRLAELPPDRTERP